MVSDAVPRGDAPPYESLRPFFCVCVCVCVCVTPSRHKMNRFPVPGFSFVLLLLLLLLLLSFFSPTFSFHSPSPRRVLGLVAQFAARTAMGSFAYVSMTCRNTSGLVYLSGRCVRFRCSLAYASMTSPDVSGLGLPFLLFSSLFFCFVFFLT